MLDPDSPEYTRSIREAYRYAGVGYPEPPPYIPLPRAILGMPLAAWVAPGDWARGDPAAISRGVFDMVGPRPAVVAPVTGDAVCPTRALFLTTDQPLNPAEIAWPGGVPPLVFYQVESTQRARHYHTMLVFNYYSASVTHLVTALGVPYIEAGRVKTSQRAVRRYMQLQSVRVITDTVGRREALGFVDYMRQGMGRAAIRLEAATLGNPAIIDRRRARTRAWYPAGYRPVPTTTAGLAHVWDGEIHRSLTPDRVGRTYNGQTFAVIPDGPSPRLHLPLTVGAYVLRG